MKSNLNSPITLFLLSLLLIPLIKSESLNLNLESSLLDDPDEMITKMKTFFDSYANKLKNSIKGVEKIILPNNSNSDKPKVEYVTNFSVSDLSSQAATFVEDSHSARERDLKNES
jgi:hypothetical protein